MNTLPAVPDTPLAGEVTGRLEMLAGGELVARLRPTQRVRDVTTRPIHQSAPEPPRELRYRCCDHHYFGSCGTPTTRAETAALEAYWLNPPWWAPVRWVPSQRRLRAQLKREQAQVAAAAHRALKSSGKEVAAI